MLKSLFTPDVQLLENVAEIVREFFSSRKTQENFKHLSGILGHSRAISGMLRKYSGNPPGNFPEEFWNIQKYNENNPRIFWVRLGILCEYFENTPEMLWEYSGILRKYYGNATGILGNTPEILWKCFGDTPEILRVHSGILRKYYENTLGILGNSPEILQNMTPSSQSPVQSCYPWSFSFYCHQLPGGTGSQQWADDVRGCFEGE